MSTRKKNYGTKSSLAARQLGTAVNATKQQLKRQPAGAEFTTTPAVEQWKCPCGMVNPARREKCHGCGEGRA